MILTFQGVDNKVGTTLISQTFAELTAKRFPGKKILLLLLCRAGRDYITPPSSMVYLDDILPLLLEHKFSLDDFYNGCFFNGNLIFFGGLKQSFRSRLFWPWMAAEILQTIQDEFYHIVIDAGNDFDFGPAAPDGAPTLCDRFFSICAQNEAAINHLQEMQMYHAKYKVHPTTYIINKYSEEDVFDISYLKNRTGLVDIELMSLPLLSHEKAVNAERMKYVPTDKHWLQSVQQIVDKTFQEEV